jgi:hypothetical protein
MGEPQAIDGVGKQSLSPNLTFKHITKDNNAWT